MGCCHRAGVGDRGRGRLDALRCRRPLGGGGPRCGSKKRMVLRFLLMTICIVGIFIWIAALSPDQADITQSCMSIRRPAGADGRRAATGGTRHGRAVERRRHVGRPWLRLLNNEQHNFSNSRERPGAERSCGLRLRALRRGGTRARRARGGVAPRHLVPVPRLVDRGARGAGGPVNQCGRLTAGSSASRVRSVGRSMDVSHA